MVVQAQTSRIRLNNTTGVRTFLTAANLQDYVAGAAITLNYQHFTSGLTPPSPPELVRIRMCDTDGNVLREIDPGLGTTAGTDYTFYMTNDGTNTGTPICGTIEFKIQAQRTTIPLYNVETDGSPNSGGITEALDQGWIRGTTDATLTPSSTDAAYPDVVTLPVVLSAPSIAAETLTLALGPDSGASNSTTNNFTRNVTVDNTFPAAENTYTPTITVPNDTLTGQPWTVINNLTTQNVTVDPRLTVTPWHFQKNDAAFAVANNEAVHTMLASDIGQSAARLLNSNGVGVNGISVTLTADPRNPGATKTLNTSTATRDTQAGWTELIDVCETGKPGGIWDVGASITAPADIVGASYLLNNTDPVTVLAPNPALGVICGGGPNPISKEGTHWSPGDNLLVGIGLFDQQQATLIDADASPAPVAMLGRFRQDTGVVEYLDANYDWVTLTAAAAYQHALTQSPADTRVWTLTISGAESSAWTEPTLDLFVVGVAYFGGTPYWNFSPVPVVSDNNSHDGYTFDPIGLFK